MRLERLVVVSVAGRRRSGRTAVIERIFRTDVVQVVFRVGDAGILRADAEHLPSAGDSDLEFPLRARGEMVAVAVECVLNKMPPFREA